MCDRKQLLLDTRRLCAYIQYLVVHTFEKGFCLLFLSNANIYFCSHLSWNLLLLPWHLKICFYVISFDSTVFYVMGEQWSSVNLNSLSDSLSYWSPDQHIGFGFVRRRRRRRGGLFYVVKFHCNIFLLKDPTTEVTDDQCGIALIMLCSSVLPKIIPNAADNQVKTLGSDVPSSGLFKLHVAQRDVAMMQVVSQSLKCKCSRLSIQTCRGAQQNN